MHFSTPNAGNFNRIPAMPFLQGGFFPISNGLGHDRVQPDFLQR